MTFHTKHWLLSSTSSTFTTACGITRTAKQWGGAQIGTGSEGDPANTLGGPDFMLREVVASCEGCTRVMTLRLLGAAVL
jgi:hypothetical protein